jgi:tetratricopeptide (TPR) repeat protein
MQKNRKEKILALAAGLAAALAGLELALAALGLVYMKTRGSDRPAAGGSAILCVGGSFTHGLGASRGGDYPSQLEQLLNSGAGGPYTVINRGVPGGNMAMTLRRLPALLDEFRPRVVLLSVSSSIYWNYWGYGAYKESAGAGSGVVDLLYRLKTWKLAVLVWREITGLKARPVPAAQAGEGGPNGWQLRKMQLPERAAAWFRSRLEAEPGEARYLTGLGMACLDMKLYDEAAAHFKKALAGDGEAGLACYGLGLLHDKQGDAGKAAYWFRRGLAADPAFGGNYSGLAELSRDKLDKAGALEWSKKGIAADPAFALNYFTLGRLYHSGGRRAEAYKMFEAGIRADPSARQNYMGMQIAASSESGGTPEAGLPEHDGYAELLREFSGVSRAAADYLGLTGAGRDINGEINAWVASDLEKAVALCRARNIGVMFVSNPSWNIGVLEETARRLSVPFADNFSYFSGLWESGERKADYRAADGWHCNDRGYRVMAENVHKELAGSGLLKK